MSEPVTYSLSAGAPNSEPYYRLIRIFTDEVLDEGRKTLGPMVDQFTGYMATFGLEEGRKREEYLLDLLSFGLLWNSYGGYAMAVRRAPFITLARMAEWRKRHPRPTT